MTAGYGIKPSLEGAIDWHTAREWLTRSRNYWVATVRPDGRPHSMPVWGLWWNEALYFSSDPLSVKGQNLAANPRTVIHVESGDEAVVLEGVAERVVYDRSLTPLTDDYEAKYAFRPDFAAESSALYRLRPLVALAWRELDFPTSASRWQFTPA